MEKCNTCGVELIVGDNWYECETYTDKRCKSCHRKQMKIRLDDKKYNSQRMYVDGKYISKSHPLFKHGRYKTFNDAAFSSLQNYTKCDKGEVYIIKNPAWKNWYKEGKAVDSIDRCNSYQTSSPYRDYILVTSIQVKDRGKAERKAHTIAESLSKERNNEWFYIENLGKEEFDTMIMEKLDGGISTDTKST